MPTAAQLAANIANSTHSTGPRSETGKQRVADNAIRHGLTSSRVILPNEDPAEWEAFAAAVVARYAPVTEDERSLALSIGSTEWRLQRAWRAHDHLIGMATLSLSEESNGPVEPAAALADLFIEPANQRRISLNLRYLRAHERAHHAAIATFNRVRQARVAAEAEAAEQSPAAIPAPPAQAAPDAGPQPFARTAAAAPDPTASRTSAATPATPAAAETEAPNADPRPLARAAGAATPAAAPAPTTRAERRANTRAGRKAARKAAALAFKAGAR